MTDSIETRVARGVALLDEKLPGWVDRINTDRLRLSNGCDCIFGQEFARRATDITNGFVVGISELLGGSLTEAVRCGFTANQDREDFKPLTAEWRRVILARRGGAS